MGVNPRGMEYGGKTLDHYKPDWSWDNKTHYWLQKKIGGRSCLNFPCGMSHLGVRADLDPAVDPEIMADITQPLKFFEPLSYDVVLCDPPFDFYYMGDGDKHIPFPATLWIRDLVQIAREEVIFSTPNRALHLKSRDWAKQYHLTEVMGQGFIRIWQIFKRKNTTLLAFDDDK